MHGRGGVDDGLHADDEALNFALDRGVHVTESLGVALGDIG